MLQLTTATIAPLQPEPISVFASADDAMAHICDHVLTRPESHYWSILVDGYRQLADPTDDGELDRIAVAMWNGSRGNDAQRMYDGYAAEIANGLQSSIDRCWFWQERLSRSTRWCGIGLSGVYVVWDRETVVTAMLTKYAAPRPALPVSFHDRKANPRPRRDSWRNSGRPLLNFQPSGRDQTRYKLFKDCATTVRREHFAACKEGRVQSTTTPWKLKSIPDFPQWKAMQHASASGASQSGRPR